MIVYLSGTGNSRYCARMLAHLLGDEIVDAGKMIKGGGKMKLTTHGPWIFVSPVYGWQIPRVFQEFLRTCKFTGGRKAYFVTTCGSDVGNAGGKLEELCEELCFQYQGILPVHMPENYIAMFDVPAQATIDRLMDGVGPILEEGAACIREDRPFPGKKVSLLGRLKSGVTNGVFYRYLVGDGSFFATDDCISCGTCVEACMLNNIKLRDGKPTWLGNCTHCMACITSCPREAIEYGKASQGKVRYRCREYEPR